MVRFLCDHAAVIYAGRLKDVAPTDELFGNPRHPYTRALLSATPMPDPREERAKKIVPFDPKRHTEIAAGGEMREIAPRHFVLTPDEYSYSW